VPTAVGGFSHLVLAGRPEASTTEVRLAKQAGRVMVHPAWIERCAAANDRANEADFPPTYDRRKADQLGVLIESTPNGRSATAPSTVPRPARLGPGGGEGGMAPSPLDPDELSSSILASRAPRTSTALQPPASIEHTSREWNDLGGEESVMPPHRARDDSSPASRWTATQPSTGGRSRVPGTVEHEAGRKEAGERELARQAEALLAQLEASDGPEQERGKAIKKRVRRVRVSAAAPVC